MGRVRAGFRCLSVLASRRPSESTAVLCESLLAASAGQPQLPAGPAAQSHDACLFDASPPNATGCKRSCGATGLLAASCPVQGWNQNH